MSELLCAKSDGAAVRPRVVDHGGAALAAGLPGAAAAGGGARTRRRRGDEPRLVGRARAHD